MTGRQKVKLRKRLGMITKRHAQNPQWRKGQPRSKASRIVFGSIRKWNGKRHDRLRVAAAGAKRQRKLEQNALNLVRSAMGLVDAHNAFVARERHRRRVIR